MPRRLEASGLRTMFAAIFAVPFATQGVIAAPGETFAKSSLEKPATVWFGDIEESCHQNSKGQQWCIEHRPCVNTRFNAVNGTSDYFVRTVSESQQYLHNGERPDYCSGEPDRQTITVYRAMDDQYSEIGTLKAGECYLAIAGIFDLQDDKLLKSECSFTGTGHFVDEALYVLTERDLEPVMINHESIVTPALPSNENLGYSELTVKPEFVLLTYWANPRYCQCVASYSVRLSLRKSADKYELVFVADSYAPKFTSLSNEKNRKGLGFYQRKDYTSALASFLEARDLDHSNYEAISNLGLTYLAIGDLSNSIEQSRYVHEHAEGSAKANAAYNLGTALEKQGSLTQALSFFEEANSIQSSPARQSTVKRIRTLLEER